MELLEMLSKNSDDWVDYQICKIKEPAPLLEFPVWNKSNEKSCWQYSEGYVPNIIPKKFSRDLNLTKILLDDISKTKRNIEIDREQDCPDISVKLVDENGKCLLWLKGEDISRFPSLCARLWIANAVVKNWL